MKRIMFILVCLFVLPGAFAQKLEKGKIVYELNGESSHGRAKVIGYMPKIKNVNIPAEIKYKGRVYIVEEIDCKAYKYNVARDITSVTIPNTVWKITDQAFSGCTKLEKVRITNKSRSKYEHTYFVGKSMFSGCTSLTEVVFEEGVKWESFQDRMFAGCTSLKKIVLPETLETIYGEVFENCSQLESIELPGSVTFISDAFKGCTSLKNITLTKELKYLGSEAFRGCKSLQWIIIPSLTHDEIGHSTFEGCTSLFHVELPDNVDEIGSNAFGGCTSLMSIKIPDNVPVIKNKTFNGCTALKEVKISPSSKLKTIEKEAFRNCSSLETIQLPAPVREIHEEAFAGASSLRQVTLPDSIRIIAERAFEGCTSLQGLRAPKLLRDVNLGVPVAEYYDYEPQDSLYQVQRAYFLKQSELAEQGDAASQYALYECYKAGMGCPRIESKSKEMLMKAYENDFPEALYEVALLQKDDSQQNEIMKRAAEMGHEKACSRMAWYCKDKNDRITYFIMAADAAAATGTKASLSSLGYYLKYLKELGVSYDPQTKAITYIEPVKEKTYSDKLREEEKKREQENLANVMQIVQEKQEKAQRRRERWIRGMEIATQMANAFNEGMQAANASSSYRSSSSKAASRPAQKNGTSGSKSKTSSSSSKASASTSTADSGKKMATSSNLSNRKYSQQAYDRYASMLMSMYYGNSPFSPSNWKSYQSKMRDIRIEWENKGLWLTKNTRLLIHQSEWETKSPNGRK